MAVTKVQVAPPEPPSASLPAAVAVYVVAPVSAADGVKVTFLVALSYAAVPVTAPPVALVSVNVTVDGSSALEKTAAGLTEVATDPAPSTGVVAVTVGGR